MLDFTPPYIYEGLFDEQEREADRSRQYVIWEGDSINYGLALHSAGFPVPAPAKRHSLISELLSAAFMLMPKPRY